MGHDPPGNSAHHWQRLHPAQRHRLTSFQVFCLQSQVRHTAQQGVESDLRFHAHERRAQAVVNAMTKSAVGIVFASDVEFVRVDKLRRATVGRRQHDHYLLSFVQDRVPAVGGKKGGDQREIQRKAG